MHRKSNYSIIIYVKNTYAMRDLDRNTPPISSAAFVLFVSQSSEGIFENFTRTPTYKDLLFETHAQFLQPIFKARGLNK